MLATKGEGKKNTAKRQKNKITKVIFEFQLFIRQIWYGSTCGLCCTVNFRITDSFLPSFFSFGGAERPLPAANGTPHPTGLRGFFHIPFWYEDPQGKLATLLPKCKCSQPWLTYRILAIQIQNQQKCIVIRGPAHRLCIQAAFAPALLGNTLVEGRQQITEDLGWRTCTQGELRKMLTQE